MISCKRLKVNQPRSDMTSYLAHIWQKLMNSVKSRIFNSCEFVSVFSGAIASYD